MRSCNSEHEIKLKALISVYLIKIKTECVLQCVDAFKIRLDRFWIDQEIRYNICIGSRSQVNVTYFRLIDIFIYMCLLFRAEH